MRSCLLVILLLSSLVGAEPVTSRAEAAVSASRPQALELETTYFKGTVEMAPVTDLRDCKQFRLTLNMTNTSQKKAYWALSVLLLDSKGKALGAYGFNQGGGEDAGKQVSLEENIGMSLAAHQKVRSFRLVFYEDTQSLGSR